MALSPYFTDEELETQLRLQFSDEEQWDTDFKVFFNHIQDIGDCFFLRFRGREFTIDKITATVTDINPKEDKEEDV